MEFSESHLRIKFIFYVSEKREENVAKFNVRKEEFREKERFEEFSTTPSPLLGNIPCVRPFVWVRQPSGTDCAISIEYDSELVNQVSKNSKSWNDKIIRIIIQTEKPK